MKNLSSLREDLAKYILRPARYDRRSATARKASALHLDYYGFGRYGKNGKVQYYVNNNQLIKFPDYSAAAGQINPDQVLVQKIDNVINDIDQEGVVVNQRLIDSRVYEDLVSDEKASMNAYTGFSYRDINRYLTKPPGQELRADIDNIVMDDSYKIFSYYEANEYILSISDLISSLDNLLDDRLSPMSFISYSGKSNLHMEIGETYILPVYTSTSLSLKTALGFISNMTTRDIRNNVILQFNIKKGQKGFFRGGHETEFILPRNIKIKASSMKSIPLDPYTTTYVDNPKVNLDIYVVDIVEDQ